MPLFSTGPPLGTPSTGDGAPTTFAPTPPGATGGGRSPSSTATGATSGGFVKVEERVVAVRSALARIPDVTDRTILILRFFVGTSISEVARGLKLGEEEVRERYRLSLRRMEEELGGWL